STKPFFVWLHIFDPHSPYQEREPFIRSIRKEDATDIEEEENYTDSQIKHYSENVDKALESGDFMVLVKHPMTTKTDQKTIDKNWTAYLSEISYVDLKLNWLKRRMMKSGTWMRSLVLLTSDHGEGFDHDYYFAHGDRLWESAVRVPWILKLPMDSIQNQISRTLIRHEDIFPTIKSFCSINLPVPGLDGYDLKNTMTLNLAGMTPRWMTIAPPLPRKNISEGLIVAAYDPHFKLIRNNSTGKEALYLLSIDPAEQKDVSEKHPDVRQRMSKQIVAYIRKGRIPVSNEISEEEAAQSDQLRALGYIQ
ncbi:sulfatase-like hydrolase/transferase, partial [bacterium]|nr:sulfatase-like hydrolase/transferase [bacterium]